MEDIIDIIVTETTNLIEITSQPTDDIIDVNIIDNREDITLNVTPSVVEININSLTGNFGVNWGDIEGTLSNQTDLQNVLNAKADLVDGKVPSSQLPSYVDDVVEVANYASLPVTGEVGKIYITLDTNFIYRWTGSTYVEIKDSSAVWGAITGTLSSQTDLQNALNTKEPNITSGTTLQYWRGDKSWQILNTTIVPEGTNLYFTDSRARAALSAGTGISYNSGTGIITNTITQYTDALARNAVSLTTTGSNGSATYNSTTGVLNVPSYTLSGLGGQPLATNLTALAGLSYSSLGFIKMTGVGTLALDTNTYALDSAVVKLTGTQSISGVKTMSNVLKLDDTLQIKNIAQLSNNTGYTGVWAESNAIGFYTGANAIRLLYAGNYNYTMPVSDGTLALTSQLSAYLPLSGGTLTGALSGTSATFSGTINLTGTANSFQVASIFRNANRVFFGGDTGGYFFQNSGNTATVLQIADSGAATFSSSVTTTDNIFINGSGNTNLFFQQGGTNKWIAGYVTSLSAFRFSNGASDVVTFTNGGNVGIGTASPNERLSLAGSTGTAFGLSLEPSGWNGTKHRFSVPVSGYASILSYNWNGTARDNVSYGSSVIGLSQGQVTIGVGTGNPLTALTIVSTGAATFSSSVTASSFSSSPLSASPYLDLTYNSTAGLKVNYDAANAISYIDNYYHNTVSNQPYGDIRFRTKINGVNTLAEALTIKGYSGNVGIGTTAPTDYSGYTTLHLNGKSGANGGLLRLTAFDSSSSVNIYAGGSSINFNTTSAVPFVWLTQDTERMRITSSGNVLIGTTTDAGYKLDVNGSARFQNLTTITNGDQASSRLVITNTGTGGQSVNLVAGNPNVDQTGFSIAYGNTNFLRFTSAGAATFSSSVTATSFFESSDATIKTLITDNYQAKGIESVVAKLYTKNGKEELGYYAQDVQGILPNAVSKGSDGLLSLSYREVLVAKVQRTETEIDKLKKRVAELEQQLNLN